MQPLVMPNYHKNLGLTLVELLTVIAIIAILAALLLTGFSHAKNQAAKTTDLSNLHQTMIALHVYTDENKDVLTWPNWDYGEAMPDGTARAGWLYKIDLSLDAPASFKAQGGLLWDALHDPKVFLCPMDQPIAPRAQQLSS